MLRHSCASILISQGIPITTVAKNVGRFSRNDLKGLCSFFKRKGERSCKSNGHVTEVWVICWILGYKLGYALNEYPSNPYISTFFHLLQLKFFLRVKII